MRSNVHSWRLPALALCCYIFFFLGNSLISLTSPDEVFYALTAKEMAVHGSWSTPYIFGAPQFEKPVLTYFLVRLAFAAGGVTAFSARFFPALFAAFGVFCVYWLGWTGFRDPRKAFMSAVVLLSGVLYIGLARTLFTDMIFTVFIALSLLSFYSAYIRKEKSTVWIMLFFVFAALATLTKGPLGAAIPFLICGLFLIWRGELAFLRDRRFAWGLLVCAAIALPWYALMVKRYGNTFIHEFFYNDHWRRLIEAEHRANDRWYFYPMVMIGCMFPWSLYVLCGLARALRRVSRSMPAFEAFLICWIAVVFAVFQPAHSKLTSYILPIFPALALVTGDFICAAMISRRLYILFPVSLVSLLVVALLPFGLWLTKLPAGYIWAVVPAHVLGIVIAAFCIVLAGFVFKKKLVRAALTLAFINLAVLAPMPFIDHHLDAYVSNRDVCRRLSAYAVSGPIICSKAFVRGVHYYTGTDVAVFERGKNFFSPHPIPFFSTDDAFREFLRSRSETYCVLRRKQALEMSRVAGPSFAVAVLEVVGDQYLVKITRLGA